MSPKSRTNKEDKTEKLESNFRIKEIFLKMFAVLICLVSVGFANGHTIDNGGAQHTHENDQNSK